jgi:hypothetical protein
MVHVGGRCDVVPRGRWQLMGGVLSKRITSLIVAAPEAGSSLLTTSAIHRRRHATTTFFGRCTITVQSAKEEALGIKPNPVEGSSRALCPYFIDFKLLCRVRCRYFKSCLGPGADGRAVAKRVRCSQAWRNT